MAPVQTYLELRDHVEAVLQGLTACPWFMVDQPFDVPPLSPNAGAPAGYVVCDPVRIGSAETVTPTSGELYGDVSFLIHVDRRTGDRTVLAIVEAIRTLFADAAANAEPNFKYFEPLLERGTLTAPDDTARYARRLNVPFHWVRG